MSKTKTYFLFLLAVFLLPAMSLNAQNYFEDTVWTKKTDQASGFWKVKFSTTDTFIVGHGMEMGLFYDAKTGEEIIRIPGIDEVFFFNNDLNFLRINNSEKVFEIFDIENFKVTDSLKSDGTEMVNSPFADVSDNQQLFVSQIANGFRVWNLNTKNIEKTKLFPIETNLLQLSFSQVQFICNDSKIIGKIGKVYEDPEHQGNPDYYKNVSYFIVFDSNSLDSVDYFPYARSYRMSKSCQQIAVATGDPTYGVEMYDFNTKQLLHKLPVNGPSLRVLEFSPDDKYLVTNPNIMIWDVQTGENTYVYTSGSTNCLDVSHNGKYLFSSVGRYIYKWHARFGNTSSPEEKQILSLLYPNPTTGEVNIDLSNHTLKDVVESVRVFDVLGMEHPATAWHPSAEGNVRIDVSSLSPGVYFIKVGGKVSKFLKI